MLSLVARRALVRRRLLAAVVVLVAASAGLVGICSLLLGETQERAFHVEIQRSPPEDVDVTAYLVDVTGPDLLTAREQARRVAGDVLGPMRPTVTSTVTARMRRLGDTGALAYLATDDAFAQRADLTSGRWPEGTGAGPAEAVVPDTSARLLDLAPGDRLVLGSETGLGGVDNTAEVVVVGTYRPHARAGWDTDPLDGSGFEPAYSDGAGTVPAYGPFVVDESRFLATGSSVAGVRVTAHPTLDLADETSLRDAVDALAGASGLLSVRVDDQARITRVASDLPRTLARVEAQQASTRATVLVVLLLGTALSLAAALLAGWLVASVRDEERMLLVALGLSRRQQVAAALLESLLVALAATVLAVPAAGLAHSRLTHLPDLRAAGLTQPATVTWELVLAVLAAAVVLALALVVTALETGTTRSAPGRRWFVARSGLDLALLTMAAVAWWQLRSQPETAVPDDATLTIAPVLWLAAATVVGVRLVPPLLAGWARLATRSRALVLPLAAQQAARRSHAGTSMVLVAAAVAASVFALALHTTWQRSQEDQAALRVGTDLSLSLPAPAGPGDAAAVVAALEGAGQDPVVSPVTAGPLALGRYVGEAGSRPVLVAVDTRQAGALLRGRAASGTTWTELATALDPGPPVVGLPLPDGGGLELTGTIDGPPGVALTVTPTAVVQDAAGFRASVAAAPLPLDGRPHPVEWLDPIGPGQQLVGVRLDVDAAGFGRAAGEPVRVSVVLRIPDQGADEAVAETTGEGSWEVLPLGRDTPVRGVEVSVEPDGAGTELRTTARLDLTYLAYTGAVILATAFPTPDVVSVVVSQELADAVGAGAGDEISAFVGGAALPLRVTAVVPTVPSAPGQVAVLADVDTLSRASIGAGRLEPVVDGWWVAAPTQETAAALRALEIGDVTTREQVTDQLRQGPLRVTVPSALLTLVAAAVVLLLAGIGLVLSADRQRRSAEVARLRALGLRRKDAHRLLLLEHSAFLVPLVLVGALVGAAAAFSLSPLLVRSDLGAAPVPEVLVAWPWAAEGLLVGGVLLASLAVTAAAAALHVRRSDPAHLRTEDDG